MFIGFQALVEQGQHCRARPIVHYAPASFRFVEMCSNNDLFVGFTGENAFQIRKLCATHLHVDCSASKILKIVSHCFSPQLIFLGSIGHHIFNNDAFHWVELDCLRGTGDGESKK